MIIVGLTGGIASGKTTVCNFLKNRKFLVHDSDVVVKKMYSTPNKNFLNYIKKIGLKKSIKGKKINKPKIRESIFKNKKQRKLLEKYIHKEVKESRDRFLKNKKQSKIVFLDIPLLFEKKLEKICDIIILVYCPAKIRIRRAMQRRGMTKKVLLSIVNSQINDKIKKKKSDFIINTNCSKSKSFKRTKNIIEFILSNYA